MIGKPKNATIIGRLAVTSSSSSLLSAFLYCYDFYLFLVVSRHNKALCSGFAACTPCAHDYTLRDTRTQIGFLRSASNNYFQQPCGSIVCCLPTTVFVLAKSIINIPFKHSSSLAPIYSIVLQKHVYIVHKERPVKIHLTYILHFYNNGTICMYFFLFIHVSHTYRTIV